MRFPAVVLLLTLPAAPAAAQEAASLKWKLKEGDKFFSKSITEMNMSMKVMGNNVDVKMTVTSVERFRILSIKQDSTTVELTMQSMEMKAGGAVPIPGLGAIGDRMKGSTVSAVLDENMSVKKLEGYTKFIDKIAGDDETTRKTIESQFSEAVVGQMFTQVFSFGTNKPVKPGETWTRNEKMSMSGLDATVKQKYTLDSVTDGIAKLGYTADLKFKAGNTLPGLPPGVMVDNFDMKADKFGGTMKFDTKLGRLVSGSQDADVAGTMTIAFGGQKIDVGMIIKMKSETTVTEKNPVKD